MGKNISVEIEALGALASVYKSYDGKLETSFKQGNRRIESELQTILRKYADYSSVTSKVYSLQRELQILEQKIKSAGKASVGLGENLIKARQLYVQEEQEAKRLVNIAGLSKQNKLLMTKVGSTIGSRTEVFGRFSRTNPFAGIDKGDRTVITNLREADSDIGNYIGDAIDYVGEQLDTVSKGIRGAAITIEDQVQNLWLNFKANAFNYLEDATNCVVNWIDESPLIDWISSTSESILYGILDIFKGPMKLLDLFNTDIGLEHVPLVEDVAGVFGFDYDEEQGIFYTKIDAWQRKLGYFDVYDDFAAIVGMPIDCEPIRFEYGGREWKIELWKGQYYGSTGCEIGVYVDEFQIDILDEETNEWLNERIDFGGDNNCAPDEDLLEMDFVLYRNGEELFHSREREEGESEEHWWETGFKPGVISKASELTMDINIKFDNEEMAKAFVEGLANAGYDTEGSDSEVQRLGNQVSFVFDEPKIGH